MERKQTEEAFVASGRSLEDSFFLEQDRQLLASKAELAKLAETQEALASVSGIKNQDILKHLVEIHVRPETLAALSAIPLIEVVWADGTVDEKERKVVLDFAAVQGIAKGTVTHDLLERWLERRPTEQLLAAWQHYVEGICDKLSVAERQILKDELLKHVRAAAEASGGFLGLGKVSSAEQAVLAKLEASFTSAC
jgi:hypothetical protein